ncbi:MAG: hypothetical protein ISP90_07245 [Nevskia sp.]|nr:hypothetical protein [Nevskia sp.]
MPNLAEGDRLWIKADLPPTQSAHYLMVAAFLSGSTNPPPESWFFPCKTWTGKCARDGLTVTVPPGAGQVLVFLAPATGGDFRTLRNAVRGRPGAFVRTSQDLNQAELDRSRLERYLVTIRALDDADPSRLKDVAPLLARSLAIKVDDKCLDRSPELQAPCLMQGRESLILNDGHSTSMVEALTSTPGSDLLMEASATQQLGYGYYSPYFASVLDIARIFDSFRTAEYQYIPALVSPQGDKLALTLNTVPSFYDPKSVLAVALPAVEPPQPPPLHAVDPKEVYCASRAALLLPVEGAPLVFSTDYAHDLALSLSGKDGKTIDLPARADAAQGGFVVDASALRAAVPAAGSIRASLHGYWGFEPYQGPRFQLRAAAADGWSLAAGDEDALIVGRQDTVHLRGDGASCVESIALKDAAGQETRVDWKADGADAVEVKLPLQDAQPGPMSLLVAQYGGGAPQAIPVQAFADAGRLDGFAIHAGDAQGVLKGSRLDQVAGLSIGNIAFVPGVLSSAHGSDELAMVAQDAQAAAALASGSAPAAKVKLKDGRVLRLAASVDAPRPRVALIAKSVQASAAGGGNIQLANQDELPQDAALTFSVRAQSPPAFPRGATIEVAAADGSFSAILGLGDGSIRLEDSRVAVATLDPIKAFGPSAFGPLQFRVRVDGVAGDWQPLATLVRLPMLKELQCPQAPDLACKLSGADLFLVDSVSGSPQFDHPVQVPDGFPGYAMPVPRPNDGRLYLKLRDDPSVVNSAALAAQLLPPVPEEATRPGAGQADPKPGHGTVFNPAGGSAAAAGASSDPAAPPAPAAKGAAAVPAQQQPGAVEPVSAPPGAPPGDTNAPSGPQHTS